MRPLMMSVRRLYLAVAALSLAVTFAASEARSACEPSVDRSYLDDFTSNPRALVARYPNGGGLLTSEIRALAATKSSSVLNAIERSISSATRFQKAAIGRGLAQAKMACLSGSSPLPRQLDDFVRRLGDADVTRAFARTTDEDAPFGVTPQLETTARIEPKQHTLSISGPLKLPGSTKLSDPFEPVFNR